MATKEELIERAQIVRLYEANTTIGVPSELDLRFRRALMIKLATVYSLPKKQFRPHPSPLPQERVAARASGKAA